MNSPLLDTTCPSCGWTRALDRAAMLDALRKLRVLRPTSEPENDVLCELLRSSAARLPCGKCESIGLRVSDARESVGRPSDDDENWQQVRACQQCGLPIPAERLEVFPDGVLCVACQSGEERGARPDAPEYCERCGSVLQIKATKAGIARYVMYCPNCRR